MNWKNESMSMSNSICAKCRHGLVRKGFLESQENAFCTVAMTVHPVPYPVRECTDYEDRRQLSFWEMKEYALILIPAQSNRAAGFITVEQFRAREGEDAPIVPLNSKSKRE